MGNHELFKENDAGMFCGRFLGHGHVTRLNSRVLQKGGFNFVSLSFLRTRMLKGRCNETAPACEARLRQSRHGSTNPIF